MFALCLTSMTDIIYNEPKRQNPTLKLILMSIAIVVIVVILVYYFGRLLSPAETQEENGIITQPTIPEAMKPGEVGEIEEGKTLAEVNPEALTSPVRPLGASIPASVFDTKGEIVLVERDAVKVMSSGENFEDQRARELRVKFASQTITFEKGQQVRYVGLEGLEHLEIGQKILISSSENIRGKTEFIAAYINKI